MDKENKIKDKSNNADGSNIDEKDNYFQPYNSYASDEENNNDKGRVIENW